MNNNSFLVSIIIPSYNMEEYLGNNLRQLVAAKHLDKIEIIIVNDGSKDQTSTIAHSFQQQHPQNIIVVDKENAHYGSCINTGLAIARGKYFRILDADDWFKPEDLDKFVERLENCDADLVVTLRTEITIGRDGTLKQKQIPINTIEYGRVYDSTTFTIRDYSQKVEFNMHSMTYKTEILRQVNLTLPTGICYTDLLYCLIPLSSIKSLVVYDIYLYNYLVGREGNSTNQDALKRNLPHICQVLLTMFSYIDNQNSKKLTVATKNNQFRYVDEAVSLMMQSIRLHHHINPKEYQYIARIITYCKKYNFKNKYLKKYYFRIWLKLNTRGTLNTMLAWYKISHPFKRKKRT